VPRMTLPATDAAVDLDALVDRLTERLVARLAERLITRPTARYLSPRDAGVYAGLSTDSIRGMLASGRLTALRPIRGRVLVDRQELDAVIHSATARPRRGRGIRNHT